MPSAERNVEQRVARPVEVVDQDERGEEDGGNAGDVDEHVDL